MGYSTLHSPTDGAWTVQAVALRRYLKGRYQKHGIQCFAYAIHCLPRQTPLAQVFEWYRRRFGIETSYRQMNHLRAGTTSRNPVWRLLWVGLAFILVNLYITLRRTLVASTSSDYNLAARLSLSLERLATVFRQAIELLLGSQPALFCPRPTMLS